MREDGAGGLAERDGIDGISEHSSDEADSDSEEEAREEFLDAGAEDEIVTGSLPPSPVGIQRRWNLRLTHGFVGGCRLRCHL